MSYGGPSAAPGIHSVTPVRADEWLRHAGSSPTDPHSSTGKSTHDLKMQDFYSKVMYWTVMSASYVRSFSLLIYSFSFLSIECFVSKS